MSLCLGSFGWLSCVWGNSCGVPVITIFFLFVFDLDSGLILFVLRPLLLDLVSCFILGAVRGFIVQIRKLLGDWLRVLTFSLVVGVAVGGILLGRWRLCLRARGGS